MLAQSKDILDALEKNLGMKVQGFVATDYNGVIEALRAKHLDIAYLGPFSYVLATTVTPVEAFAIAETAKSGRTYYHSQIIAKKIERHQNARRSQGQELRLRRPRLDLGLRLPAGRPAEGRHRAQARLQDGDLHRRARRQRASPSPTARSTPPPSPTASSMPRSPRAISRPTRSRSCGAPRPSRNRRWCGARTSRPSSRPRCKAAFLAIKDINWSDQGKLNGFKETNDQPTTSCARPPSSPTSTSRSRSRRP